MGKSNKECSICVNSFIKSEIIYQLPCGHIFHKNCLKPWLGHSKQCPNCRFDVEGHFNSMHFSLLSVSNSSESDKMNSE